MLAINGQDGHLVFGRQLAYQFASHHQRLLVGQTNFLARLDGVYGGVQAGEAHHSGEHHINGVGLYNLTQGLGTSIHLDVGAISEQFFQAGIVGIVSNDHGGGVKLSGLFSQLLYPIVGRKAVNLKAVGVLSDNVERLCADRAC